MQSVEINIIEFKGKRVTVIVEDIEKASGMVRGDSIVSYRFNNADIKVYVDGNDVLVKVVCNENTE